MICEQCVCGRAPSCNYLPLRALVLSYSQELGLLEKGIRMQSDCCKAVAFAS